MCLLLHLYTYENLQVSAPVRKGDWSEIYFSFPANNFNVTFFQANNRPYLSLEFIA